MKPTKNCDNVLYSVHYEQEKKVTPITTISRSYEMTVIVLKLLHHYQMCTY